MQEVGVNLEGTRRRRLFGSTADKTTVLRALGHLEPDQTMRNPDFLAQSMIEDLSEVRIPLRCAASSKTFHAFSRWFTERSVPGSYWQEIARVKYFDEILLDEVSSGVPQVVMLGAGLDTRGYRFASDLAGCRTFEVDHPVTGERKRERLRATFGEVPSHVTYVSADLTIDDLGSALIAHGFDPSLPAVTLWIGVTMYLSQEAVADVLGWASDRPLGSSIAFDYIYKRFFKSRRGLRGARRMRTMMQLSGERLTFGLDPDGVETLLHEYGLFLKDHKGPKSLEERYLRERDGTRVGRPLGYSAFVHAEALPS